MDFKTKIYVWVRTYSHTDRRHWLQMVSEMNEDPSNIKEPTRKDAFLISVKQPDDDLDYQEFDKTFPFMGATWTEKRPDKLHISTRELARECDAIPYAILDATARRHLPVVIKIVKPINESSRNYDQDQ